MASAARLAQVHSAVLTAELARRTANGDMVLWPGTRFRNLQPPSLSRLRTLVDPNGPDRNDRKIKLARATVAALMSTSARWREGGQVEDVLTPEERAVYKDHSKAIIEQRRIKQQQEAQGLAQPEDLGSVCGYCDLLNKLAHGSPRDWPSLVINHDADIEAGFDADTFISSGRLKNFKVLTKDMTVARSMVLGAHPLMWSTSAPQPFKQSLAAELRAGDWHTIDLPRDELFRRWRRKGSGPHFLYESVESPWTEYLSYRTENIIRIDNLEDKLEDERTMNAGPIALSYDYRLENPLRSNFGFAWEAGGLDVDRGSYRAVIEKFDPDRDKDRELRVSCGEDQRVRLADAALKLGWQDQACKVTISAVKELRYTTPREGPPELRSFLNWTSPALICTFLNRGICQPVHELA